MATAGERRHTIELENPGEPVSDNEGGFTVVPVNLGRFKAKIEPSTQRNLERLVSNTVASEVSHVVSLPYVDGVTTKTNVLFGVRVLQVVGIQNPEERNLELRLACVERVA